MRAASLPVDDWTPSSRVEEAWKRGSNAVVPPAALPPLFRRQLSRDVPVLRAHHVVRLGRTSRRSSDAHRPWVPYDRHNSTRDALGHPRAILVLSPAL